MMKIILIIAIVLQFCNHYATAQNLVKNPSFEEYNYCPYDIIPGTNLHNQCYVRNNLIKEWTDPNRRTSDFYHSCDFGQPPAPNVVQYPCRTPDNIHGFQYPKSGLGYTGFLMYYNLTSGVCKPQEYIQGILSSKLVPGRNYCSGFWTSLSDDSRFYTYSFGMFFNDKLIDTVSSNEYCESVELDKFIIPQITNDKNFISDTMNWSLFSKVYTPTENNQQYIIIGNFTSVDSTELMDKYPNKPYLSNFKFSYYYFDDVFVYEQKPVWVYGGDVSVCDTVTYVLKAEQAPEFVWWEISQPGVWLSTRDTLALPPGVGGTYVVRGEACGYVTYDTVTVTRLNCGLSMPGTVKDELLLSIYPNPASASFTLQLTAPGHVGGTLHISDMNGRRLASHLITQANSSISAEALAPGIYALAYERPDQLTWRGKLCVNR